jgi:UDP-N-acetylmuramyl tripeptide synthase
MKRKIAIYSARLAKIASKLSGKGGTALPGLVADRIDPDLLPKLMEGNFDKGIIVVTGTNGKTTVSSMISNILTKNGISHIRNSAGSNMKRGIVSTLLDNSDNSGRINKDMAVFEIDEAYVPVVCPIIKPSIVVVTNLFRDQLDRYGELDKIANSFKNTFHTLDADIILNADDPLVASLSTGKKTTFFGISNYIGEKIINDHTADSIFDMQNGEKLKYLQRYYGHIGIYRSSDGNTKRPKPQVEVTKINKLTKEFSQIEVKTTTQSKILKLKLPLAGIYNIYNAIASITVADSLKLPTNKTIDSLINTSAAFGRAENIRYRDTNFKLLLIKNPTGFNQVIQTFLKPKPRDTDILIAINDKIADGRDVSWLWDTAIEDITDYSGKIVCTGTRAYDMALRLKYAGIKGYTVEPDIPKALETVKESKNVNKEVYVLPTYTAMLELRAILTKQSNLNKLDTAKGVKK